MLHSASFRVHLVFLYTEALRDKLAETGASTALFSDFLQALEVEIRI